MNWRLGLGLVLLVAALFSGWSAWKQRGVEEAPVAATDRSDYLMRDFEMISLDDKGQESITLRAVSYTHLDVYKRQVEQGLTDQVLDDPQHAYTQLLVSSVLQV